jgi:hypothetical protein
MNDFKSYSENNKGQNSHTQSTGAKNNNGQSGAGAGNNGARRNFGGNNGDGQNGVGQNAGNVENTINLAQTLAKAFSGKSEGQILQTIIAQAEQGKRDGTLTNQDLDNFYKALSPLLDGFKRKKLAQIINKLKAL